MNNDLETKEPTLLISQAGSDYCLTPLEQDKFFLISELLRITHGEREGQFIAVGKLYEDGMARETRFLVSRFVDKKGKDMDPKDFNGEFYRDIIINERGEIVCQNNRRIEVVATSVTSADGTTYSLDPNTTGCFKPKSMSAILYGERKGRVVLHGQTQSEGAPKDTNILVRNFSFEGGLVFVPTPESGGAKPSDLTPLLEDKKTPTRSKMGMALRRIICLIK